MYVNNSSFWQHKSFVDIRQCAQGALSYSAVKLFSKYCNVRDHGI